mgnify:CR=1 FL=1
MTTQETIKKAVDYAKENNIKNIVVATTTGGNFTYLEDEKDLHIVGVTNVYDQGRNQMLEETRKHFEEAGIHHGGQGRRDHAHGQGPRTRAVHL